MTTITGDLTCFVNRITEELKGITGIQVDDSIGYGT